MFTLPFKQSVLLNTVSAMLYKRSVDLFKMEYEHDTVGIIKAASWAN